MSWSIGPDGLNSGETYLTENFPKVFDASAAGTYSYTNTSGNTDYNSSAYRLAKFTDSGTAYLKARIYKQGDLNYTDLINDIELEWHCWSASSSNYNLYAKAGPLNNVNGYLWCDSNKELWFWSPQLWTQYGRFEVLAASSNVSFPFTTTANMHTNGPSNNWAGQTRQLVNNSTSISIENAFGGPA